MMIGLGLGLPILRYGPISAEAPPAGDPFFAQTRLLLNGGTLTNEGNVGVVVSTRTGTPNATGSWIETLEGESLGLSQYIMGGGPNYAGDCTLEVRLVVPASLGTSGGIFSHTTGNQGDWEIYISDARTIGVWMPDNGLDFVDPHGSRSLGEEVEVAYQYDAAGNAVTIWVDGVLMHTEPTGGTYHPNFNGVIALGDRQTFGPRWFGGQARYRATAAKRYTSNYTPGPWPNHA
jgi:hypothetical protein